MYYRCARIALVIYDVTCNESFQGAKDWINECLTVHRTDEDSGAGYGYYFWNFQFPIGEQTKINGWFMAGNGGNIVLILPELESVIVVTRKNYNSPTMAIETIKLLSQYIIPKLLN